MEYLLIGMFVAAVGVGVFFATKSKKRVEITPEDEKSVGEISSVEMNRRGVGIGRRAGISEQKPQSLLKESKAMGWTASESYEKDMSSVNIDSILSEDVLKEKDSHEDSEQTKFKTQILLVDDSLVVRKYIGDLLKKNNYEVLLKNDGWEAITYLNGASSRPKLIISDMEMPNMNGSQLVEAIRADERFADIPVLIISAHAESHLRLMESGNIQGFIKKPFDDSDLIDQLSFLLEN